MKPIKKISASTLAVLSLAACMAVPLSDIIPMTTQYSGLIAFNANAASIRKCYTINNENTPVYGNKSLSGSKIGTIYGSDEVTVYEVYDKASYVGYPTANGEKKGWIKTSAILLSTGVKTVKSSGKFTSYKRSTTSSGSYGAVYLADSVTILGEKNSMVQIKYPVSGGYKYAFCTKADAQKFLAYNTATISYKCHVQDVGDMQAVSNGATCGTIGRGLRMEYLDVKLSGVSGGIKIQGHIEGDGWTSFKSASAENYVGVGTKGKSKRLEAVTLSLTGAAANTYSITYRVHVQDVGWMPFVSDGAVAGTTGRSLRIEAIEIKLVPKISSGTTADSVSSIRQKIVSKALGEVGQSENGNNNIKYNTWYYGHSVNGTGYAWCNAFVSWCANQCGVKTDIIPKSASVANTKQFYEKCGRFYKSKYNGGNYIPKTGDLVFYRNSSGQNHIGIIIASPVDGYLQVVEGNVTLDNGKTYKVVKFTKNSNRTVNSSYVVGYASPNY